ncbi:MAG TPA: acyl carrier protein [Flavobacteriales bacterium]|nr:acyl carrier protein [Flavobacteriales bacterium]
MEKVLSIVELIRPDVDFAEETALIDDGVLDSFDIVSIISDLNDEYEINIRVHDLTPENFNSVEAIVKLVERKREEA